MTLTSSMNDHEVYQSLVAKEGTIRHNQIKVGGLLKYLKEDDRYKLATGGVDTWNQFLKQPEIGLTVSKANTLIDIYDMFVDKLHISEDYLSSIPFANLKRLLPEMKRRFDETHEDEKVEIVEILEQARTLSDKDFKNVLVENNETYGDQPRTYTYMVMRKCNETGNLNKVHDISSEDIVSKLNIHE